MIEKSDSYQRPPLATSSALGQAPRTYHELIAHACAETAHTRYFQKATIVVTSGNQSDAVYLVRKGELKICVTGEDGKELILNVIHTGESFGELAVLTGAPRSADVISRTPCELMIIGKTDYLRALKSDADLAIAALVHHARMVHGLTEQVSSLALVDVFGRVAGLLKSNAIDTGAGKVVEGMSHQDIAAAIGASREMVSKILGDLKKGGYIDTQRMKITLLKRLPKGW